MTSCIAIIIRIAPKYFVKFSFRALKPFKKLKVCKKFYSRIGKYTSSCKNYIFINILLRKNFCFRSGDNADEILPPSNLHGSQLTQTGASSVNRHQQDRKDSSKLIAIMNSMKKSEKKKFQLLLQQFTNSNDRLVSQ